MAKEPTFQSQWPPYQQYVIKLQRGIATLSVPQRKLFFMVGQRMSDPRGKICP